MGNVWAAKFKPSTKNPKKTGKASHNSKAGEEKWYLQRIVKYVPPHITQDNRMPNMTLSIAEEMHKKMKRHTELKWSDVARQAFEKKVDEVEFMEKVLSKSELGKRDAERIGHEIKSKMSKRFAR
jgi:hypothetical protein